MTTRTPRTDGGARPSPRFARALGLEPLGWAWQSGMDPAPARRAAGEDARRGIPLTAFPRLRRLARTAVLGVAGVGAAALAAGFLVFVAAIERTERAPAGQTDAIVALTGGAQRIDDAIDLLAAGYGRRLLISGVNERTSRDEIARLNPSQRHWIACCVDLDYRARNTIGNAIETRRWMRRNGFGTVAVVTSNYHMPRTLVEIGHALGTHEAALPCPVVPAGLDVARWWTDPAAARLLGAEYVKFLAAWLRTRFEDDPERSRFAVLVGRGRPVKRVAEPAEPGGTD